MARPRPLRPLGRPCLDALVLGAAPERSEATGRERAADRRTGRAAWTIFAASGNWAAAARAIPSIGHTSGVETTTGPLGQGIGNSVGMAIASRWLAARYNRPGFDLFDFNVYALCSDGDMMEGVGAEAASLAGHLKLSNLCWIYDDNKITIEGHTSLAFSEDVGARFAGYGWNVLKVEDVNDLDAAARRDPQLPADQRPAHAGDRQQHHCLGAPKKQNTTAAHGAPLGEEEIRLTKAAYGWPQDEQFLVPEEVRRHFREGIGARGQTRSHGLGR